jgi:hypothetical protein
MRFSGTAMREAARDGQVDFLRGGFIEADIIRWTDGV